MNSPRNISPARLRTLVFIVVGSFITIYGLGAREIGGFGVACDNNGIRCHGAQGFAVLPLVAVVIGSMLLSSQCKTMRSFKNMYMLGSVIMSYAILSAFLSKLACGFGNEKSAVEGCSGATFHGFAHLTLSGLLIVVIATVYLKVTQSRGRLEPDPQRSDHDAEMVSDSPGDANES